MTNAPDDLMAVRRYLLGAAGLSGDSVGIVAGPADASGGGYHCGRSGLSAIGHLTSDYSVRESGRDSGGLTDAASALDIGDFAAGGKTLRQLSAWLAARCAAGDPRTADIREIIYTPDGSTVRRWDRLGIRSTGDSSHLYHTHLSFFRDSEGRRATSGNILGLLTEFFDGTAPNAQEDDMGQQLLVQDSSGKVWLVDGLTRRPVTDVAGAGNNQSHASGLLGNLGNGGVVANFGTPPNAMDGWGIDIGGRLDALATAAAARDAADQVRDAAMKAALDSLAAVVTGGGGSVDTAAITAHIDAKVAEVVQRLSAAVHAEADALDG